MDNDLSCATVNQGNTPSPWPYTPKAGTSGIFPQGSFFEGGINVSKEVPGSGCFSTFVAETRSSTPFDSRLKDFALGEFNTCSLALDTDASTSVNGVPATDVVPGTSVSDTVTATGTSLTGGSAPRPTGTVEFFLCQPSEVTAAGCPVGSGTKVGATKTLLDKTPNPPTNDSTATSDGTTGTTTDAIGKYCWRAEYTADAASSYDDDTFTNAVDECFTTVAAPTTTTTRQFVYPQDKALITPPASGGDPTGTVTFKLFDSLAACDGTADPPVDPVYTETDVPLTTTAPFTAKTNNNPDNAESYAITDGTTHYWKASFDSTNNAQLDSESACVESTDVTFVGDNGSINVPDKPPSP